MQFIYYFIGTLLVAVNFLPLVPHQHWIFRVWDFGRIQLFFTELSVTLLGWIFLFDQSFHFYFLQVGLVASMVHNVYLLHPYTRFFNRSRGEASEDASSEYSLISVNVFQDNPDHHRLIHLIKHMEPDMFLTMESNKAWDQSLSIFDDLYPFHHKVPMENTYGMHFYSKQRILKLNTHYFVADDVPSLEIRLELDKGDVTLFCVHPPPPSPTEESTSKERDGDLLSVAKRAKKIDGPVLVVGDFNSVAWAPSSRLFRRVSQLIDPRRGYGFVSTFHAKYKLLRVPIDLIFHSTHLFVKSFKTLSPIGSDHLPMYCRFLVDPQNTTQEADIEVEEGGDEAEVNELIQKGKQEKGDGRKQD